MQAPFGPPKSTASLNTSRTKKLFKQFGDNVKKEICREGFKVAGRMRSGHGPPFCVLHEPMAGERRSLGGLAARRRGTPLVLR